ncbi:helix-turn-helix domain-containing protein [Lysinibacillus sp. 38-6]|uniref:helix-turn-helix domain-containing protein n=1 Tax=Lysinibacillus sp. 38-6 TaxID=3385991 RepID=UPI0039089662
MTIEITLKETLENTTLTRNAIAVKAGIRPATLHEIVNEKSKGITFETLNKILDAMNELDKTRTYDIKDIFVYEK